MSKSIYVYENWSGDIPVKLGKLYVDQARGSEVNWYVTPWCGFYTDL